MRCYLHEIDYRSSDCPRCAAEERHRETLDQAQEGVEETIAALEASDYRRANPGDYQCPHCRYVALKRDASRCPLCRGAIGTDYWKALSERERAETERRRAEWERGAPARAAAEAAAATAAAAAAEANKERATTANLWFALELFYICYLGPALLLTSWSSTGYEVFAPSVPLTGYFARFAWTPVMNLCYVATTPLVLLAALVNDGLGAVFWLSMIAIFWVVVVPTAVGFIFRKHT